MIGKMFEVRNKLILEYMHVKGKKEAYKRGLKEMWNSSGDEMLYKYCQSVIINHGKDTCIVTERTDKSETTNSALGKGNWEKQHLLIAKN